MFSSSNTSEEFRPSNIDQFWQLYSFSEGGLIKKGGHGTVFSSVRLANKTPVAIKVIHSGKVPSWDIIADRRLVPREVACLEIVANVEGVICQLDWFCIGTGPEFVIVMERPNNAEDLLEFNNRRPGDFDEDLAQNLFSQLVKVAQGCHQVGVLHCDIKEENILINRKTKSLKLFSRQVN